MIVLMQEDDAMECLRRRTLSVMSNSSTGGSSSGGTESREKRTPPPPHAPHNEDCVCEECLAEVSGYKDEMVDEKRKRRAETRCLYR